MILKKGLIPPNLDFVTQKPGLKLDERHIKVPRVHYYATKPLLT
jgi:hypothetical protein